MKTRILSSAVLGAIVVVLAFLPVIILQLALAFAGAAAEMEILRATGGGRFRPVIVSSALFAVFAPFFLASEGRLFAYGCVLAHSIVLIGTHFKYHRRLSVEKTGLLFMLTVIAPVSIAALGYLRAAPDHGTFYMLLTLLMIWQCDSGAYLTGTFFGKRKLCPAISPKKTVEGLAGGIVISILSALAAAWVYQGVHLNGLQDAVYTVNYLRVALLAMAAAPVSVLGDLFASTVKRHYGVKDYGAIMPGHGGVMDRLDSLMLTAPMIFVVVREFPLIIRN
ncbi:MAG: phosphatidate cytidylyltransferase [Oscillospiraceae bacterium]|nr:phosphatidate cytidylyltransferase [Oscillospiraceae bacterium]